ncbi:MAG: hypothetical protein QXY49_03910 [Thermofilaceae archaeon]
MEFYELIKQRRSIRTYKPGPVEEDKLLRILKTYWKVDVAIAMEHIVLAAANEGLRTCWIGLLTRKL